MSSEGVILLHGIFRTKFSMRHVERLLKKNGYAVLNVTYPSTRLGIEELVGHIRPALEAFSREVQTIHFVGYSMGGLLIRHYLTRFRPPHLGRVVMIGTPNGGSEVADFLCRNLLYRRLAGPAGQQLVTSQGAFSALFGPVDYPVGVIAGSRSIDPFGSRIIGKPSDGKVSIDSTRLEGMHDHVVIPSDHFFMPRNKQVLRAVLQFLKHGSFAG